MARTSRRQRAINRLRGVWHFRRREAIRRLIEDDSDSSADVADAFACLNLVQAVRSRYHHTRARYRRARPRYQQDLEEGYDSDGEPAWLNDVEFLRKYRCSREDFDS